jgi:hypothetical protein
MSIPLSSFRDFRHAANESVHRTANEFREAGLSASADWMKCECECHRPECGASFQILIGDYQSVRAVGRQFVVTPDHQDDTEEIVRTTAGFLVVAKAGEQGMVAEALNPR